MNIGDVWTLAEFRQGELHEVSHELLAWGRGLADTLGTQLCSIILTNNCSEAEIEELAHYGADKIYLVDDPSLGKFMVEPYAHTLSHLVETYQPWIFLASATTTGRTVMPYLSMSIHTGLTADCTDLAIEPETNNLLQIRPAIGGNIMATIKTPESRPQMATVRPKSILPLEPDENRSADVIRVNPPPDCLKSRMEHVSYESTGQSTAALEEAKIVVSGGRGVQEAGNFSLLEKFAAELGGVAASARPPVDLEWQPYSRQVGLTGKTISPDLYIACGISGAVQHLAGIQTAKNIVAINIDPDAPIFHVSDFGIVGDIFDMLPVLIKRLENNHLENNEKE
ncbi:MAG: electron transfer flavoprotein subunit alpha/FixB family protein [Chloroflexota bacterium]|nr:electron transfer flavoprotein subunit alpha/FixB family protein [Chloroflexota bacterium]